MTDAPGGKTPLWEHCHCTKGQESMRKRQRGTRPVSDEPLSAGRVEYLEQARERVRNRRIRRTALIVVALTLVVLFTTGIVGSSVAMAKDWADTARILLFPGTGWPQQTGVMEVKQLAAMNSSFVELGEEGCVVWSRTGTRLNSIQSGYARPALAVGKNRFVLYNRSGNELRVESRTQNLYTKTMESSITLCAMADNGTLAVVTEDPGSAARLRVYSSSMEQLLSWSLTITDGTPLRLAFSPDGRRLAVAAVTVNGLPPVFLSFRSSVTEPEAASVSTVATGSVLSGLVPVEANSHGSRPVAAPMAMALAESMTEPPPTASTKSRPSRRQSATPLRTREILGLGDTPPSSTKDRPASNRLCSTRSSRPEERALAPPKWTRTRCAPYSLMRSPIFSSIPRPKTTSVGVLIVKFNI